MSYSNQDDLAAFHASRGQEKWQYLHDQVDTHAESSLGHTYPFWLHNKKGYVHKICG